MLCLDVSKYTDKHKSLGFKGFSTPTLSVSSLMKFLIYLNSYFILLIIIWLFLVLTVGLI